MMWQWNSQLPARSGVHVIAMVPPDGSSCVTTRRRCCVVERVIAQAVAQAVDLEVEAVQVHRVGLRAEVDRRASAPAARARSVNRSVAGHDKPLITNVRRGLKPDEHLGRRIGGDDFTQLRRR